VQEIKPETSDPQLLCDISAEEISCALTKMLASRTFQSARGQSKFLSYAVTQFIAGHSELIKEYWIGREALGRGDSFDPRHDPIVRTQARKLRLRLAKYYQTEGVDDEIYIEFPKGSYVPVFRRAPGQAEKVVDAHIASAPQEVIAVPSAPTVVEAAKAAEKRSFPRNSMALGIPICVIGGAIALAIYRWLSN
jgi:hypothetical protein